MKRTCKRTPHFNFENLVEEKRPTETWFKVIDDYICLLCRIDGTFRESEPPKTSTSTPTEYAHRAMTKLRAIRHTLVLHSGHRFRAGAVSIRCAVPAHQAHVHSAPCAIPRPLHR
eukprot:788995-Prymnesium_polylepis.1